MLILVSDHSMDTMPQKISLTDALTGGGIPTTGSSSSRPGARTRLPRRPQAPSRFELLKKMREVALATPGVADAYYREPNPRDAGRCAR